MSQILMFTKIFWPHCVELLPSSQGHVSELCLYFLIGFLIKFQAELFSTLKPNWTLLEFHLKSQCSRKIKKSGGSIPISCLFLLTAAVDIEIEKERKRSEGLFRSYQLKAQPIQPHLSKIGLDWLCGLAGRS